MSSRVNEVKRQLESERNDDEKRKVETILGENCEQFSNFKFSPKRSENDDKLRKNVQHERRYRSSTGPSQYDRDHTPSRISRYEPGESLSHEQNSSQKTSGGYGGTSSMAVNEDMKISKLLRRLGNETNAASAITLCEKLIIVLNDPSNFGYVRKSFDILAETIMSLFKNGSAEYLDYLVKVFALMGYVTRSDFSAFKKWIVRGYKSQNKSVQMYMVMSLTETFRLDEDVGAMKAIAVKWMDQLKVYLEDVMAPDLFIELSRTIEQICRNNPEAVRPHFSDIVDIVIGWHLETDQSPAVKFQCSKLLQNFSEFFQSDTKFTVGLLGQLIEDIQECPLEFDDQSPTTGGRSEQEKCFWSFLGTFNTILKCVYTTPESLIAKIGDTMLVDSFQNINTVSKSMLENQRNLELITLNEYLYLMVECSVKLENNPAMNCLIFCEIIKSEIELVEQLSAEDVLGMLSLLLKLINEFKTAIPIGFISIVLSPNSKLMRCRFLANNRVHKCLIKVYQEILNLKNFEVLQEVYKHVLNDLGRAMKTFPSLTSDMSVDWWLDDTEMIADDENVATNYSTAQAEVVINFYLAVLASLATTNSSIIAMWALQPTILTLLITKLRLSDYRFWTLYPATHYAILSLLVAHCRKNNNFIASSILLKTDGHQTVDVGVSPTAGHFEEIVKFLAEIFNAPPFTWWCHERITLMLDFVGEVFHQATKFAARLKPQKDFSAIVVGLNRLTVETIEHDIQLKFADCLDCLGNFETLHTTVYTSITEVCCVQMCSTNADVRRRFSYIFSRLPLEYSLAQINTFTGLNKERVSHVLSLQQWMVSTRAHSDIKPDHFKRLMEMISLDGDGERKFENFLLDVFSSGWYLEQGKPNDFKRIARLDARILIGWIQWEAAQVCVQNKLRTPLGKAQDTFIKIESIVKAYARILALKEKPSSSLSSVGNNLNSLVMNQRRARIMLGFLEALEKVIYNAGGGTAFAMPAPDKMVRQFFRINTATCNEWFNRIRPAVNLVAIHCMEPEMVIRCGESILKWLVKTNKVDEAQFEETLMSMVWAFVRTGETNFIYGLHTWTKQVCGGPNSQRKFRWLKCVAEQAAGKRESAVEGYLSILRSEDDCPRNPIIREYIVDQVISCLLFLAQYQTLYDFLVVEEKRDSPRVSISIIPVTSSQVAEMMRYEETGNSNTVDMSCWTGLFDDQIDGEVNPRNDFSYYQLIAVTENTLAKVCMQTQQSVDRNILDNCYKVIHSCLHECLRTRSKEHLHRLTILNHVCHKLKEENRMEEIDRSPEHLESLCVPQNYGSQTLNRLLFWSKFFDKTSANGEQQNTTIRLNVSAMARKEGNFQFCRQELNKFFQRCDYAITNNLYGKLSFDDVLEKLLHPTAVADPSIWTDNMTRGIYEASLLLYALPKQRNVAIQLAAATSVGICVRLKDATVEESPLLKERVARVLFTLAEWLQSENDTIITSDQNSMLVQLLTTLPDVKPHPDEPIPVIVSIIESSVGKLIQHGIKQCPDLAKSWGALGNWCYKWGRKMVEIRNEDNDKAGLRVSDVSAISNLIPTASAEDIQKIVEILNQHRVMTAEDEDIDPNETSSTEMIEAQLRSLTILADHNQNHLLSIIDIWRQAHKTVYGYYEIAADAYFKYLQLTQVGGNDEDGGEMNDNCSNVTATLRLLRLVVKHALGLQEVLEEGLATTPTTPWKVIIPQLFSRMNHHEPYVRRRMSELICRVAKDAPHLIIFPTVVGSTQEQKTDIANISIPTDEDGEEITVNIESGGLVNCFNSLLETLSQQAPETVQQVQLLVRELKRITLLWDELWLVTLAQIYSEWLKKFISFEQYTQRLKEGASYGGNCKSADKSTLIAGKYSLMMKPVIFVMERLYEITSRKSETNNERQFQEKFMKIIEDTIRDLKKPFNAEKPHETWQSFKTLYSILQQRSQKKSFGVLKMMDISPVLAQLKNTSISMPGVETFENESIYIRSVENNVHILPSKTKPKKLVFIGSNGKRYTYLFKSLEDLHLDERIMQFLSIANTMMAKSIDCTGRVSRYRARHYSVIPLGPRSGLISWVDGVIPIFALYKKWQQREAVNPKKDKTTNQTPVAGVILRPSEMFYNKLNPLLLDRGIKPSSNRKDWPVPLLTQVLSELTSETPHDLLARELWCHSTTTATWRQVVQNYSSSLAVMSVIGYVIGLGDRHLDNILVELSSGEIVHIDYNVCFEKGHTLRVPEKVPFRMTPNLEDALGVTGVQGTFWLACENVLRALKKGRETLLTLLEAFVYDPLVDWAVGEDGAGDLAVAAYGGEALGGELRQARKQLVREVALDTLAIRITEIKPEWLNNRDEISKQLTLMQLNLNELKNYRDIFNKCENQLDLLSKEMALIREAEALGPAMGSHQLATISQRYNIYRKTRDELELAKSLLTQKSDQSEKLITAYTNCLTSIKSTEMNEYTKEVDQLIFGQIPSEFEIIRELMESSAQSQFYIQCQQTRYELDAANLQQLTLVRKTFDDILQYGAVVNYFPQIYHENHRSYRYVQWTKFLIEQKSVQACRDVVQQYQTVFGVTAAKPNQQFVISFAEQLIYTLNELHMKVKRTQDRLANEFDINHPVDHLCEEARSTLQIFLQNDNKGSLNCVAVTALCDINKRFLMMENAAASAGENLVDLTTDGKWFLDELFLFSSLQTNICRIISTSEGDGAVTLRSGQTKSHLDILYGLNRLYSCFRQMHMKFATKIVPIAIEGIIAEDKSILEMISAVSNLQQGLMSLSELQKHLHYHLYQVHEAANLNNVQVSGDGTLSTNLMAIVEILKLKLSDLMEGYERMDGENQMGKLLILELNQLFVDLDVAHNDLMMAVDAVSQNTTTVGGAATSGRRYIGLDQVKSSHDLAAKIFNKSARPIVQNLFVVMRLDVMIEFFGMCLRIAYAFKGAGPTVGCDDELLNRPLRKYIADRIQLLGLGCGPYAVAQLLCHLIETDGINVADEITQNQNLVSLEDLCRKSLEAAMKSGRITGVILNNASTLCANYDLALRKREQVTTLKWTVDHQTATLNRLQLMCASHSWIHDDILNQNNKLSFAGVSSTRANLLNQWSTNIQNLSVLQTAINNMRDEMATLSTAASQRLKWAVGANPNLIEIVNNFEQMTTAKKTTLDRSCLLAAIALKSCSSLYAYEAGRSELLEENRDQDQLYLNCVSRWEKSVTMMNRSAVTVSQVEEALVELLDPEGPIDGIWLSNVKALINDMTEQIEEEMDGAEKDLVTSQDDLQKSGHKLQLLIGAHHQIAADLIAMLKLTLKHHPGENNDKTKGYLMCYKQFMGTITELQGIILSKDFTEETIIEIASHTSKLLSTIDGVFENLFWFGSDAIVAGTDDIISGDTDQKQVVEGGSGGGDGDSIGLSKREEKASFTTATAQTEQKRNAYAVSVWRRIRMKLEGRDPDPTRRCTVPEQVNWMIREAMNPDNLAVLYEGWTPWI